MRTEIAGWSIADASEFYGEGQSCMIFLCPANGSPAGQPLSPDQAEVFAAALKAHAKIARARVVQR